MFKSKAQMRWAATPAGRKALGGWEAFHEWAHSTPDIKKLPEKVKKEPKK